MGTEPGFSENPNQQQESREEQLRIKRDGFVSRDFMKNQEIISQKAEKLMEKYQDYDSYLMFHILAGSGTPKDNCPKYDFPSEDSVEDFINSLE